VPAFASHALGALAFHAPLAFATFSAELRCEIANPEFARLAGRSLDEVAGLPWLDIFPSTLGRDVMMLRAVLAGTASGVLVDLLPEAPRRRCWDGDPPAGHARHPAVAYRVDDVETPLLGLMGWQPNLRPVSWHDLRDIETTSVATVRRRIWMPEAGGTARDRTLLLAADVGASSAGSRGSSGSGIDLLGLASNLLSVFRADDILVLLRRRWPILACAIDSEADVGLLCDRFRMVIQHWKDVGSSPGQPFEFRMAVGQPGASPVDLLARLDTPVDWEAVPRPVTSFTPVFLRGYRLATRERLTPTRRG
jgi:hypothetical protein